MRMMRRSGSGANFIVRDIIVPLHTHYRTQAYLMKGVKLFYLPGVQSPRLTVVKQRRWNDGVVQCELSFQSNVVTVPNSASESSEGLVYLTDPVLNVLVGLGIIHYYATEICKSLRSLEIVTVDFDRGWSVRYFRRGLVEDLRFLYTSGETKVPCCSGKRVNEALHGLLCVRKQAAVIRRKQIASTPSSLCCKA